MSFPGWREVNSSPRLTCGSILDSAGRFTPPRDTLPSCYGHGELQRIESNGLLFGVLPDCDKYPVCTIPLDPGDRFLLYTDGVTDPENANGDSFGDKRLEDFVRCYQSCPPIEFSEKLLSELRQWQPASLSQQDDITLIVIDT